MSNLSLGARPFWDKTQSNGESLKQQAVSKLKSISLELWDYQCALSALVLGGSCSEKTERLKHNVGLEMIREGPRTDALGALVAPPLSGTKVATTPKSEL